MKFRKGRRDAAAIWSIEAESPSNQPARLIFSKPPDLIYAGIVAMIVGVTTELKRPAES
jgi:hypothetical protein